MNAPYRQRLHDALDALDAAFAPLSGGPFPAVGGCTYCYAEDDLQALAGPVDAIPEELLPSVAAEVTDHWDDFPGLYRRMTPRIIRLLVMDRLHVDHGLVATRLVSAGCREWDPAERAALEAVWHAWWQATLLTYPAPVTDVLEAVAVSTGTAGPWLTTWADTHTEEADHHLRDALAEWLVEDELADLRFGFYDEFPASPVLLPWLLSLADGRIDAAQRAAVQDLTRR